MIKTKLRPEAEAEITSAIRRVYQQYGRNLSAFFSDVQSQIRKNQQEKEPLPLSHSTATRS